MSDMSSGGSDAVRIIASKVYSSIAKTAERSLSDWEIKLRDAEAAVRLDPSSTSNLDKFALAHNELLRQSCIVIVFAAAALEAYIYDYGARKKSDTFMKKYVDKLDLVAKWAVVPQLVLGKPFPTDRRGFELLGKLASSRNKLIHFKSGSENESMSPKWLVAAAKQAVEALNEIVEDMAGFDPDESPWLDFSEGTDLWTSAP